MIEFLYLFPVIYSIEKLYMCAWEVIMNGYLYRSVLTYGTNKFLSSDNLTLRVS